METLHDGARRTYKSVVSRLKRPVQFAGGRAMFLNWISASVESVRPRRVC